MSTLFEQLGGLVLGSLPTMILFLITLLAYRVLVHTPMRRVLGERAARTTGAMESAAAATAAAEAKTSEYEHRLRTARTEVFRARQEHLHRIHIESEQALAAARAESQQRVAEAVLSIEHSADKARLQLESAISGLTAEVLRAVLPATVQKLEGQAG